jgi:hypothetical protein
MRRQNLIDNEQKKLSMDFSGRNLFSNYLIFRFLENQHFHLILALICMDY